MLTAVALAAAAGSAIPASAQSTGRAPAHLVDVPYLPQSEDLCGGAAAAMVMRYWGARDIYADAFAPLVDHSAGGIRTTALAAALQARGWTAVPEAGTISRIDDQLALGRPVIALIAVGRGRYHYVVVVAHAAGQMIVHDPARAPLRSIGDAAFERAWAAAERWMITPLPPPDLKARQPVSHDLPAPSAPASCAPLVERGIAAAEHDPTGARAALEQAAAACPSSSAPWRELAGLDVLGKDWAAAARNAGTAVARDPGDAYAWDILGTARYLSNDDLAALSAWNRASEPLVDLVNVSGLTRTRYRVVYDAVGLGPRVLLTPGAVRGAARRVSDVPALAAARVAYRPLAGGLAQVDVAVVERDPYPRGWPALAAIGARAAVDRTIEAALASPTGGGELLQGSWRWWAHRPAFALSLIAPAPPAVGGTWRLDFARQTETFAGLGEQSQVHAGLGLSRWLGDRTQVTGTAGIDRWSDTRRAQLGAQVLFRPISDTLQIRGGVNVWPGQRTFATASADLSWRSSAKDSGQVWSARVGGAAAAEATPPLAWPGADTGHVRETLLRAHPLLDGGVIRGGVFGRRLIAGGVEWRRWSPPSKWLLQYAPAVFVDVARASHGLDTAVRGTQVDAGIGARLSMPGAGILRIDLARGLRDGRTALSVGWER